MSPDVLAAAYLAQYRSGNEEDFQAFEDVINACGVLDTGLAVTLRLIEIASNDTELSYIAAGPVEDMLIWHGKPAIEAFGSAAEQSIKVRQALAGVWISAKYEAFAPWKVLMDRYYPGEFNWESSKWTGGDT